jgi:hypothetical protein
MPALVACGPVAFPGGCLGACAEAAGGHTILAPGQAGALMQRIQPHHTHNRAEAGDGVPPGPGVGLGLRGGLDARQCHLPAPPILVGKQGQVARDALPDRGSKAPCRSTVPLARVGQLLPQLGPMGLAVGMLEVRPPCHPCAPQRHPPPEEGARGAPRCRRARGLRAQSTTEEDGELVRIALGVCGFAPVHRLPREGLSQHQGQTRARPKVGEPIPGDNARDSDDKSLPRGGHGLEQRLWACGHGARPQELAMMSTHTDVHGAGMPGEATVTWVLLRVASPAVSSSCVRERFPSASRPPGYAEGEASISINRLQATANSLRSCVASAIGGA